MYNPFANLLFSYECEFMARIINYLTRTVNFVNYTDQAFNNSMPIEFTSA